MAAADDSVSCNDCSAIPTIIDPKPRSRLGAANASRDAWNDAHANDAASADEPSDDDAWILSRGPAINGIRTRSARSVGRRANRRRKSDPAVKTAG